MAIWTNEIKELEKLYESLKGQFPDLEKELERLVKADDENMILLYSRRCLEVIITDLCECELKRPRKTEPLKGIIDKLHKEEKVPSNIITSMDHLNSLSAYGAHPKDFDPEQVKPVLINLDIIIKWYVKYKDFNIDGKPKSEGEKFEFNTPRQEKSIIVLPFENMSSDPEQEYFSDGLTEEIITDLSYIHNLLVISRSSAMTFKGTKKTVPEIAKAVKVRYVLEGSVRKAGNNLRITAQLIDALTDTHQWAEKFSGTMDDVFEIQEKVSKAIVDGLKLQITPEETRKITERPITNLKAYEYYLRAMYALDKATENSINEALRNLELALQIVGENVVLYYEIGYAYWWLANIGITIQENLNKCKDYAQKALEIDPLSTRARALFWFAGINYQNNQQLHETHVQLKEVLKQDPNDSLALLGLLFIYTWAGQISEAMLLYKRYTEGEPLSFWTFVMPFFLNLANGQYERALEEYERGLEALSNPQNLLPIYAWALAWAGRTDEAVAKADRSAKDAPDSVQAKLALIIKYGIQRNVVNARAELKGEFFKWCYGECTWSYFVAASFALANAIEDAIEWLEHAVDLGWINYPLLAEKDPFLENIRGEERFKKLMERVKHEWENFEV